MLFVSTVVHVIVDTLTVNIDDLAAIIISRKETIISSKIHTMHIYVPNITDDPLLCALINNKLHSILL